MTRIPLWADVRGASADVLAAATVCDAVLANPGDDVPPGLRVLEERDGRLHDDGREVGRLIAMDSAADQDAAAAEPGIVIVDGGSWTIIPLENLIAARRDRPGTLFGLARSLDQVRLFRDTLEVGVHGIVLAADDPSMFAEADRLLRARGPRRDDAAEGVMPIALQPAKVTRVEDAGMGDRVCVDCTSVFSDGEGLLIGSTARSYALVHAETLESAYVRARPFRVNAGAIHSYMLGPGGKTRYLSEAAAGQDVLAVARSGRTRVLKVGRAKIEKRPHTLIEWDQGGVRSTAILQTAETIRLVRPDGTVVAVTDLAPGDVILVHAEHAARHFGMPVDEHLEER